MTDGKNERKGVGMEKLVVTLKCPHCKISLMNEAVEINDFPSIRIRIQYSEGEGALYLSSVYGSYDIVSEVNVPENEIAKFLCPSCKAFLLLERECEECGAPLAFFELESGGKVQVCTRRGCQYHTIEYSDKSQKISVLYDTYEVFADPTRNK
jgi:hypothetical protein